MLSCVPSGARKRQGPSPPGPRRGLLRGSGREPAGPGPRSQRGDAQLRTRSARAHGRPRQPPCSDGTDERANVACRVVVVVAVVVATTSGRRSVGRCGAVQGGALEVERPAAREARRAGAGRALITRRTLFRVTEETCAWAWCCLVWWSYGGGLRRGGAGCCCCCCCCFFGVECFFGGAGRVGSYSRQKVRMRVTYSGVSPFSGT